MKSFIALAAGTLLASSLGVAMAQEQPDASKLAADVCSSCHGPQGRSVSPVFPRLAGEPKEYIAAQLEAFRKQARGDPLAQAYMWGMASQLSDSMINSLAAYYASQQPVSGKAGDPTLMAEGEKIFTKGILSEGVPACSSCHGANAQGVGAFPRLGGQHVEYLIAQLQGFKSGVRANAPIMQGMVRKMTPEQMTAAATYAASR